MNTIVLSRIYDDESGGRLYQAGVSELPQVPAAYRISTIVLAASQVQDLPFRGPVEVLRVPMEDAFSPSPEMAQDIFRRASAAASLVALRLVSGKHVVSSCAAGLNRSGLVSALALKQLGFTADEAIARVRKERGHEATLSNPAFVAMIKEGHA